MQHPYSHLPHPAEQNLESIFDQYQLQYNAPIRFDESIEPEQLELDLGDLPIIDIKDQKSPCVNAFNKDLKIVLNEIESLLIAKNDAYGDSALNPVRIFSNASTTEQIKVRIDDKLSRLARGGESLIIEDVILDLTGYLILLRIANLRTNRNKTFYHED